MEPWCCRGSLTPHSQDGVLRSEFRSHPSQLNSGVRAARRPLIMTPLSVEAEIRLALSSPGSSRNKAAGRSRAPTAVRSSRSRPDSHSRNTSIAVAVIARTAVVIRSRPAPVLIARIAHDVPSMFIGGKSDWGVYQIPGAAESMQKTACTRMVGFHLVDGAGHWVQQEQPGKVTELLTKFLQDQSSRDGHKR